MNDASNDTSMKPLDRIFGFVPKFVWITAIALGGASALLHLVAHLSSPGPFFGSQHTTTVPFVIGQGLLYAAPAFLGVLAGIYRPDRGGRLALGLSMLSLLVAAPLMFRDLICLIFIVPINLVVAPIVGAVTGAITRRRRLRNVDKKHGAETLLLLIPLAGAAADYFSPPPLPQRVEIVDSAIIEVPREVVWRSLDRLHLRFASSPSWLIRTLLPVPHEIVGGGTHVGAERRVVFSTGVAVGTVTESHPPERFVFDLSIEQGGENFFDHWVRLDSSEISLEAIDENHTRVTHRTTYQPLAEPRWYFEPGERWLGKMVQAHMLESYVELLSTEAPLLAAR